VKDIKSTVKHDLDYFKNTNGQWTKWVVERCDETQKAVFEEF
jgi:hypothetical protein